MSEPHSLTVNRHVFPTLTAASEHFGIHRSTIARRIERGMSPEQAVGVKKLNTDFSPHPVECGGKHYDSIGDFARTLGLNPSKVRAQLHRGKTPEAIAESASQKKPAKAKDKSFQTWKIDGVEFHSIESLSAHYKANTKQVADRLKAGWSVAQALGLSPKPNASSISSDIIQLSVNGKAYLSVSAVASEFNLDTAELAQALASGSSCDQAVSALLATPKTPSTSAEEGSVLIGDMAFKSERAAALHHKIPLATFYQRRRAGKSIEDSLGLKSQENSSQSRNIEVICHKKNHPSVRALAKAYNVSPHQLRYRLNKLKMTPEEAVKPAENARQKNAQALNAKPIKFKNVLYPSIKAFADAFGCNVNQVRYRLKHGWTNAQAVSQAAAPKQQKVSTPLTNHRQPAKTIRFRGKTHRSVRAFSKYYKVSPHKVRYRLQNGWTLAQAAEIAKPPKGKPKSTSDKRKEVKICDMVPFNVGGKTFDTAADLARHYNMDSAKVSGRLRTGWSPEEAIGLKTHMRPTAPEKQPLKVGRKTFDSARALALHFKKSYRVVQYRLSQGATASQAVGKAAWSGKPHKGRKVSYGGNDYPSMTALCNTLKLSYPQLTGRLHRGWTLEEAITGKVKEVKEAAPPASRKTHTAKTQATVRAVGKARRRKSAKSSTDSRQITTQQSLLPELNHPVCLGEKSFDDIVQFAQHLGVDPVITQRRLDSGWSPEQIAGKSPPPNWQ